MKRVISLLVLILMPFSYAHALSLSVDIPEKYTVVEAGERFYFEIGVKFPENPGRQDLRFEYKVSKDNKVVARTNVLKAVETQASFLEFIVIPEGSSKGLYTLSVGISDYKDLEEEISTTFNVIGGKENQIQFYFYTLLAVMLLVSVLIIINIIVMTKKKGYLKVPLD